MISDFRENKKPRNKNSKGEEAKAWPYARVPPFFQPPFLKREHGEMSETKMAKTQKGSKTCE
ncbi:hypothetical protein SAY86_005037 [Trapa natans]|uniref:Uncharacterized protein n=1 Tax=Trapa natans TaxID=22666 RepID=A0AAN7L241_TRANT|nr:hypothetical protein SAY86_005037 [Trapa natans]